eukprot:CAMPEP_0172602870 /NCGR_PEP_ID=MMETSP1068-20121228/23036_1 /TAXON_ID=35684 /ORGANISM="Pseudopedinella elastica, Strain CCMP716" /LENGTH=287 /DNA_ID=CAMNT_0013404375 /DNA_START=185 /DNA_END=1048 /DNA_ORIENTATION=+
MSGFEAEAEEQQMEAEALASIFVDEFEQLSESPFHWRVLLEPHAPGDDIENHVAVHLEAKIPAAYPIEAPELDCVVVRGLDEKQRGALLELANQAAEENLGMAMIYTICDVVKEWLVAHNEKAQDGSMFAAMQKRMEEKDAQPETDGGSAGAGGASAGQQEMTPELEALERNKQKVFDEGTPVTAESFAKWKEAFEAETAPVVVEASKGKMTGRDYFATRDADVGGWEEPEDDKDDDDEDGPAAAEGGGAAEGAAAVENAGLFLDDDEDDSDFDDLEDSEEEDEDAE